MALSSYESRCDRLSPAEAHRIVRHKLEQLAAPWHLTPADVHRLGRQLRVRIYAPGEVILPRGTRVDSLGLVVRGQVAVDVSRPGNNRPAILLGPGTTFGEAMLVEEQPAPATLQAVTRSEVRFLSRSQMVALDRERRADLRLAFLGQLAIWGVAALVVWFGLLLLLVMPAARSRLALVPMGIGQLCRQWDLDACAARAWMVAANLAPEDENPLLALGTLYLEQGEVGVAEQYLEAVRARAPDVPEVLNNLGLIYARRGDHEEAIAAFRQALSLEPGIAAAEYNLACSLQAVHEEQEALTHYRLAASLGESRGSSWVNMAIAYYETAQLPEAADAARQALRLDGSLAPAYTVLGAVALDDGQPDEALGSLHRAVALDGTYAQAYFYLGLAYEALEQPAEATAAFEQALAATRDQAMRVQIQYRLGELYERKKQDRVP